MSSSSSVVSDRIDFGVPVQITFLLRDDIVTSAFRDHFVLFFFLTRVFRFWFTLLVSGGGDRGCFAS
jgi:hypothetical protein